MTFKALLASRKDDQVSTSVVDFDEADPMPGDVTVGAAEVIDRRSLSEPGGPIDRERWAGAIDSVGSHTLANVLAQIRYRGAVAAGRTVVDVNRR